MEKRAGLNAFLQESLVSRPGGSAILKHGGGRYCIAELKLF